MAVFKCKMCSGDLEIASGASVVECEYCGSKQTVPAADNEKKMTLFGRANRLRFACDFDKASAIYETIIADFPEEAEAYWGLVLCKYGVEYVDDPKTAKKIPTCHRSSFESIFDDSNYEQALENTDAVARSVYREEAKQIEEIRKGIVEVSSKEEPYDIFICYKESDDKGGRTIDSVIAQDVYDELTKKGYRVFFSRVTLEDKLGVEYEPYIFAALNSAKLMLVFGTDYEYFNAVWVKNEWSRFLQLIAKGEKKTIVSCYKGIDASDLPKELSKLQAQDMGKVGAMQDLLRGVEKILPKKESTTKETVIVQQNANAPTIDSYLKRAFMYLEDGKWTDANEYCEKVLDIEPENAKAYLGKLMAELKVSVPSDLKHQPEPFDSRDNYKKLIRFADAPLADELKGYIFFIDERNKTTALNNTYNNAMSAKKAALNNNDASQMQNAIDTFRTIPHWKDSKEQAKECEKLLQDIYVRIEEKRKENIYKDGKNTLFNAEISNDFDYKIERCDVAKHIFEQIIDYKDSRELIAQCDKLKADCIVKNKQNKKTANVKMTIFWVIYACMLGVNLLFVKKVIDIFDNVKGTEIFGEWRTMLAAWICIIVYITLSTLLERYLLKSAYDCESILWGLFLMIIFAIAYPLIFIDDGIFSKIAFVVLVGIFYFIPCCVGLGIYVKIADD